ncbi:MAG TPA: YidC/Oxa1 family insertase periplasmic-domain containing protein [Blastocatellia bacterium]|nr:YidC/Oxa1 family insertase periplasmic-domain containing protein [Blastocatellia bacterium]
MDRSRLIMALALSLLVLMSWPLVMRYLAPPVIEEPVQFDESPPQRAAEGSPNVPVATTQKVGPAAPAATQPQQQLQTTQVAQREITIAFLEGDSEYWRATLSNRGVVATSWILSRYKENGDVRTITGADGNPLQLIPQHIPEPLSAPLSLRTPWSPDIALQLNQANFQVEGVDPAQKEITLGPGESRTITFKYVSPSITATKSFTFHGGSFVFDVTAEVVAGGSEQAVEIVLGPRIGDQSDKQTGSYTTPPSVVAYTREGKRQQILGAAITPPFATITGVDYDSNQIELDKPMAEGVAQIKLTADEGTTLIGYARVTNREANGQRITLESLPQGTAKGSGVAQGADMLRHLYGWAGVSDHYFAMLAVPDPNQAIPQITLTNIHIKGPEAAIDYPTAAIPVNSASQTHIFVGPKDRELLATVGKELGANLDALIDYGMFSFAVKPLIPPLAWGLNGFRRLFGNYGWAIVAVTVLINLALSPLRFYSSKKMKKAAKHQPRMKELQDRMKKLKENPKKYERELQELQQEQLALMKEANPLGGCMPLLLQMPIFWAVYLYLGSSLDVRHAPWVLWIKDLSTPDPLKILPIVMCVTMIASTKLTPQPASADPSMTMQRVMMTWLMPIMLTWLFFFSAPSGLVLYWMVSNLVGVLIQLWINRMTADLTAEIAAASSGGGGGGKSAAPRATDKPGTQKRPKDKGGKRRQEGRGGAEEVA